MAQSEAGNLVSVAWLAQRLGQDDLVIADCRFDLADPAAGQQAYDKDHIPGAVFFDLDKDLSRPSTGPGGRHPLPPLADVVDLFSQAGIGDGVMVVCYDDQGGSIAGRLWWMLRYLGYEDVALLDGGYAAWRAAGQPVTAVKPKPVPRTFVPRPQPHMLATIDDVKAASQNGRGVIIDARAPERYRGEVEPLDPVAGHIPGAINMPWLANVDERGLFRDPRALAEHYAAVRDEAEPIVHCGSGVSGCLNILGLERVGVGAKLYIGGWSDWCSDPSNPVATAANPSGQKD